ncbi:MAG: hypothetical protein WKH64_14535 [Chloroflexia bacterium]
MTTNDSDRANDNLGDMSESQSGLAHDAGRFERHVGGFSAREWRR